MIGSPLQTGRRNEHLHLSLFFPTSLVIGWHLPQAKPERHTDITYYRELMEIAEAGLFDAVFAADFIAPPHPDAPFLLEPISLLSALASMTSRIGLIASVSTTYSEPYSVARILASLDLISGGRCGWNIVTSPFEETARLYGREFMTHDDRYRRAFEFADVVGKLWISWRDDAISIDKTRQRFFIEDRVTPVEHTGRFFSVHGALNVGRSPQGHPVRFMAGTSEAGRELAARHVDAVYVSGDSRALQAVYRDLRDRVARQGRNPENFRVFAACPAIIADTESEARDLADEVNPHRHDERSKRIEHFSRLLGVDLAAMPPDERIPFNALRPVDAEDGMQGVYAQLVDTIRRDRPTVRELLNRESSIFVGTPLQLVDRMQALFDGRAADGFNLSGPITKPYLSYLVAKVIPELQNRGLFRTQYDGRTLRDHLGIPAPSLERDEAAE